MSDALLDIVQRNRSGERCAIPSVCSAHEDVLRASLIMARDLNRPIVIEATSNQVNQEGGYTGMTPIDFVQRVTQFCAEHNVQTDLVVFGGDHLGPQAWRDQSADIAMGKAAEMIKAYVAAGFRKIHLDCSEGCLGEAAQLADSVTAKRSAELAKVALDAADQPTEIVFVIGTEVPPPGGARMDEAGDIPATTSDSAQKTIDAHAKAFADHGIAQAMNQVLGLVVQPGVEFSPSQVHHFPMDRDFDLSGVMAAWPNLTLEAHSTDYQHPSVYPKLAELGFGFQKVGPALTYAWRRALYALDQILALRLGQAPRIAPVMRDLMERSPNYWRGHYDASDPQIGSLLHLGLADRIRYYWTDETAQAAVNGVLAEFETANIGQIEAAEFFCPTVISRAGTLGGVTARNLVLAQIQEALAPYLWSSEHVGGLE